MQEITKRTPAKARLKAALPARMGKRVSQREAPGKEALVTREATVEAMGNLAAASQAAEESLVAEAKRVRGKEDGTKDHGLDNNRAKDNGEDNSQCRDPGP